MPRRSPDIRKLARRQRWMPWLIVLTILVQILPYGLWDRLGPGAYAAVGALAAVIHILLLVTVVLVLVAEGVSTVETVLCGIVMLAPCANILMAMLVSESARRCLRQAGLPVGPIGIGREHVERIFDRDLCSRCGYDLTGNVSGICPECGSRIDSSVQPASLSEEPKSELRAWLICGVVALGLLLACFGVLSLLRSVLPPLLPGF